MKQRLVILLVLLSNLIMAQNIVVKDSERDTPVVNVAVYSPNHKQSALTDINGIVHFDKLQAGDSLIFQHTSYDRLILSYDQLKKSKYSVRLIKKNHNLDEFTISISRWEQKQEEVSMHISTIKTKEIHFFQAQTSADLLAYSNELYVQKSQQGGGSPMIRGFAANRVLLVLDGVRLNNLIYRSGNLQNSIMIDPNSIEEAEILFGPGSVIYGSDALGGVLDFHTHKLQFSHDSSHFSANALFRFSSASKEQTQHIDISYKTKNWASITSFSHSYFDDLQMGNTSDSGFLRLEYIRRFGTRDSLIKNKKPRIQKFSGYSQVNFIQKIKTKLNRYWDAQYAFHYTTSSNIPRYDKLIEYKNNKLKYAEWHYGPQRWMMNQIQFNGRKKTLLMDLAKVMVAHQKLQESRIKRKFNSSKREVYIEDVNILSMNIDMEKFVNHNNVFTYGLEAIYNDVHSGAYALDILNATQKSIGSRYPNGKNTSQTLGGFFNWKWNLNKHYTFRSGLRYEVYHLHSGFDKPELYDLDSLPSHIDLKNRALSGSVGLVYRPLKEWQWSTNLSTGFRSPNLDDIAKIFDAEPGTMVVINPNLQSEDAYNADIGIRFSGVDKLELKLTAFYSALVNVMVRSDFSWKGQDSIKINDEWLKIRAIVNAGTGNIYGISGQLKYHFTDRLSTNLYYTWMKGKDGFNNPIRHVSPSFGSIFINYQDQKWRASAYMIYNAEIPYENLASSERKKTHLYATDDNGNPYSPAWFTLNIKLSYVINNIFSLHLGVENLLDKAYRPYSSGILAPGRNFLGTLNIKLKKTKKRTQ
jgi:hemoglobin/transferrin/lactoferrin receptor protein